MAEKIEHVDLGTLRAPRGSTKDTKRKGRGPGSGHGKTAGHGQRGRRRGPAGTCARASRAGRCR